MALTSSPRPIQTLIQTQFAVVLAGLNAADRAPQRNITRGATTLSTVIVDNQEDTTGSVQVWIKLYDNVSNAWVPGTTKAKLGFPVEARTAGMDSGDMQAQGTYQMMHTRTGLLFENGISIACTKEAGDQAVADPVTNVLAELTHS